MQFDKGFLQRGGEALFVKTDNFERLREFEEEGDNEEKVFQTGGKDKDESVALYGGVSMSELVKKYQLRMREELGNLEQTGGGTIHNRFENLAVPFGIFYDNRHEKLNEKAMETHGLKSSGIMSESMFNKIFYSVGKE